MTAKYQKTLEAVRNTERAPWGVVKALQAEVVTNDQGHALDGELKRVSEFLTKNGEGDKYTPAYLSELLSIGRWVSGSDQDTDRRLQGFPVEFVRVCRYRGKLSPADALAKLQERPDWTVRKLAESFGQKWSDTQVTPEQAVEAVKQNPAVREAIVKDEGADRKLHDARVTELQARTPKRDPAKDAPDIKRRRAEREAENPHDPMTDALYLQGALINADRHLRYAIRMIATRNSTGGGYTEDERQEAHDTLDVIGMHKELITVMVDKDSLDGELQKLLDEAKAED